MISDLNKKVEEILAALEYEGAVELPNAVRKVLRKHLRQLEKHHKQAVTIITNSLNVAEQDKIERGHALRAIMEKDGPGLDMSPGGPCYEIARKVLDK